MVARPVLLVLGLAGSVSPASAWTQPADATPAVSPVQDLDRAGAGFALNGDETRTAEGAASLAALFQPGTLTRPPPRPVEFAAILAGGVAPLPPELTGIPAQPVSPSADDTSFTLAAAVSVLPPPRPDTVAVTEPASSPSPMTAPSDLGLLASGAVLPPPRPASPLTPSILVFARTALPPARPAFGEEPEPVQTASIPETPRASGSLFTQTPPAVPDVAPFPVGGHGGLDDRIAYHARLNDVPADLVHRVVVRESKYNPRAVGQGGALGLMQIKHATARALGYGGPAKGLLDAETNLTYAVKYLAGAYRTAAGNYDRAVAYYARGYYYAAKRLAADEAASGSRTVVRGRPSRTDVLAATSVETGRNAEFQ